MTIALKEIRQGQALAQAARRINVALVVFLLFYLVIGLLQPNYFEPAGAMNFLRRAAPLAILAAGQLFVLVSGGFDLSVGSLVTLTVVGGSMLTANDPGNTWWAIAVLYAIGLLVGLINGAVVAYLRTPSIIATLGTLLSVNGVAMMWSGGSPRGYLPDNFRMFGRFVFHDVPVVKIFPVAIAVLVAVCALAQWGLHGTVFGRRVFAIGDNARAAHWPASRLVQRGSRSSSSRPSRRRQPVSCDIHVKGIERKTNILRGDVVDHFDPLVDGIDEISLESVERFDRELDRTLGRIRGGLFQACNRSVPLGAPCVVREKAGIANGRIHRPGNKRAAEVLCEVDTSTEVRQSGFANRRVFGAQITVRTECATDRHAEVYTLRPRMDRGRIDRIGILDADLNEIEPECFYAIDKIKSCVGER